MNRLPALVALPIFLVASCAAFTPRDAERPTDPSPAADTAADAGVNTGRDTLREGSRDDGGGPDEGGPLDRIHIYEVHPDSEAPEGARYPVPAAPDTAAHIEVSGTAEVSAEPDLVRVAFAVETLHETARGAAEENARRMNAVLDALRETEIQGIRIETFGYNLQPNYRRPPQDDPRPVEVENYRASNNVRVTAEDVDAAGSLIDAAIEAGANRVASLQFDVGEREPLRIEALQRAVESAEAEARAIAEALGVELGPPVEVRGGADQPLHREEFMARAMADAAPTPIEAGAQVISANVTIRYRIGGSSR